MQVKLAAVLNTTQQQQLENYCTQLADAWSQHWFGRSIDDCSVTFNQRLFATLEATPDCQDCQLGVALHYQPSIIFDAIFSLAVPPQPLPEEDSDHKLVKQFSEAILADLASRFKATQPLANVAEDQEQWQLAYTLMVNNQPVLIRLSAAWVRAWLHQAAQAETLAKKPVLALCQHALQTESVSITPRFGQLSIPLKQLLSLQVGSVITLPQPIAEPIPFYSEDKVISLSGYLVNQQGKKALYLTGNENEQN